MTTPSHPSPDDQARWIATYLCDVLGEHLASPPLDWPAIRDAITEALHAHGLAERRAGADDMRYDAFHTADGCLTGYSAGQAIRALPLPGDDRE